jgi:hypothetical protein
MRVKAPGFSSSTTSNGNTSSPKIQPLVPSSRATRNQ